MTLIYEFYLDILKTYLRTNYELASSRQLEHYTQIDVQTNAIYNIALDT